MKGSSTRFTTPVSTRRPPGARLLEAFSPKLSRRITLFDRSSFDLWTLLEADPDVLALCERPTLLATDPARTVDFWVQRRNHKELLLLQRGELTTADECVGTLALRVVPLAELSAHRTLIANWQCILPQVNATRGLLPHGLKDSVLRRVRAPTALGLVEHDLRVGDPSLVRGAIFELLRTGLLRAPSLRIAPLTVHTLLEPSS